MFNRRSVLLPLCTAFLAAACQGKSSPSGPSPLPEPNSTIHYTAIGASDALGIGSSSECFIYTECPNGKGYVQEAVRQLKGRAFTVTLSNLAIPTAVIGPDFQNLGAQYGHFVAANFNESEAPFVNANSTLVTIFAGGNEVNTVTSALGQGAGAADQIAYINSQVKAFSDDFAALLKIIRDRAPSARIIVLNLPNMAGMPFLASASLQQRQAAQKLSVAMTTTTINPLTAQNVLVVDLMCDARFYQTAAYSADGFHPSDTGYAWIAAEVVTATTTVYKTPQASCSQNTIVPGI